jgi:dihydropyrimidinase
MTRPSIMEGEATHRGIRLAELAEAPIYFVHVSSNDALKHIVQARAEGIPVFAETCPHYLLFDKSVYNSDDFEIAKYVMTPPLRTNDDQKHLWRALRYDDLQVIATDHCPFCMKEGHLGYQKQKQMGKDDFSMIPNGAPGIETRLVSLFDIGVMKGKFSLNRFVELTATSPAKLFGLFPKKAPSRWAATPTWCCSTQPSRKPFAHKTCTAMWTTPCSTAAPCKAAWRKCFCAVT